MKIYRAALAKIAINLGARPDPAGLAPVSHHGVLDGLKPARGFV